MSTDTPELDDFEQELAARMGAATDTIDATGVTREGIDERIPRRRDARRRRQGGIVLAAAALVIVAGIGAIAIGSSDDQDSTVITEEGITTEAPTTEAETTTSCFYSTTPDGTGRMPVAGDCMDDPASTLPPIDTEPETTVPSTSETQTPTTPETAPPTTPTPTTAETTTTPPPVLTPGQPCTPGSDRDCVDPDGDGTYQYLIGGADCMAGIPSAPELCSDLDGDGHAGYPDSEEAPAG